MKTDEDSTEVLGLFLKHEDSPAEAAANMDQPTIYDSSGKDEDTSDDEGIADEFKSRVDCIIKGFDQHYDSAHEDMPRYAAYHPSFVKAEALCEEVLADAVKLFKSSDYHDLTVAELLEQTIKYQKISYPDAKKVGIAGNSGVGKSSLINALLDTPELAAQGASGSACTCVVTEFGEPFADQVAPIAAEISLFEPKFIKEIIRDYYNAYYKYHYQRDEEDDEATRHDLRGEADTALDALKALFSDHEELRDEDMAEEFLCSATSAEDSRIINRLQDWTADLICKYNAGDGPILMIADTASKMSKTLEPFVTMTECNTEYGELPSPSLWPLVRLVRIGLHSPLLKRGLIILDLPGRITRDSV